MMWQISESPGAFADAARALGRGENDGDDQQGRGARSMMAPRGVVRWGEVGDASAQAIRLDVQRVATTATKPSSGSWTTGAKPTPKSVGISAA